jgi:hypothetical protein
MEWLRLAIALILPCIVGYVWLSAAEEKFDFSTGCNIAGRIGYGFFIGYAAVHGLVLLSANLLGLVQFWPIVMALVVMAATGSLLHRRTSLKSRPTHYHPTQHNSERAVSPQEPVRLHPIARAALVVVLAWVALHLLLVAVEILHRPVYAWDAWLSWIYRAKAWFYAGTLVPMDAPISWLMDEATAAYNVGGNHYPTFSPTIVLWVATALGHWNETLIHLPVLLCGIALGLGLYGQCRESGMDALSSTLAAYFLLSIPLIGAHLALPGQADIWMAGFTGLGFVAIIRGLGQENTFQVTLGLLFTAFAITTKTEGGVWLAVALTTIVFTARPQFSLVGISLVVALALLGWVLGITFADLPVFGRLGVSDGSIHIPLMAAQKLEDFDLLDNYLDNFFYNGTWHLLWSFLVLSAAALLLTPAGPMRRAITSFYLMCALAHIVIFDNTVQGRWAEDYTAINRVPMHFTPALIYCFMLIGHKLMLARIIISPTGTEQAKLGLPPLRRIIVAFTLGLAITILGSIGYLSINYPSGNGEAVLFTAKDLQIVVGNGVLRDDVGVINRFDNNIAIASSGRISLDAESIQFLEVETGGANQKDPAFFWRTLGEPDNVHRLKLSGAGRQLENLTNLENWQGRITEIGLLFYDDEGKSVHVRSVTLKPQTLAINLEKTWGDWTLFQPWSFKSVNWIASGSKTPIVSLPIFVTSILLATIASLLILNGKASGTLGAVFLSMVLAWTVVDLRWTVNGIRQSNQTLDNYRSNTGLDHLYGVGDLAIASLVAQAKSVIQDPSASVLVLATKPEMRFQVQRAKYHLLPNPAVVHEGGLVGIPKIKPDYVLVVAQSYYEPGELNLEASQVAEDLSIRHGVRVEVALDSTEGILIRLL